jgi:hypothetical protein
VMDDDLISVVSSISDLSDVTSTVTEVPTKWVIIHVKQHYSEFLGYL